MSGYLSAKTRTLTSADSRLKLAAIKTHKVMRSLGDVSTFKSESPGFKHRRVRRPRVLLAEQVMGMAEMDLRLYQAKKFHTIN